MKQPIFITGIGTGVGKTVASAVITQALNADYWKPVQAGFDEGTDALTVQSLIDDNLTVHPELYKLALPASPHISAQQENVLIDCKKIAEAFTELQTDNTVIIEGAGGLLVPLNHEETIADLIKQLKAKVILVSRNYLGSINHSLLTAAYCKANAIEVIGWLFNDQFMNYEHDIVRLSGIPSLGSIPSGYINKSFVLTQAEKLRPTLLKYV